MAPQFDFLASSSSSLCSDCFSSVAISTAFSSILKTSTTATRPVGPSNLGNTQTNNRVVIIATILIVFVILVIAIIIRRFHTSSRAANIEIINRSNQAQKERKNLSEDELDLYPIIVFSEQMLKTPCISDKKTTKTSIKYKKNSASLDIVERNPIHGDDDSVPTMLKSASNIISSTFYQVKSGIFGPAPNSSNVDVSENGINIESECLICFEKINIGDKIRLIPCNHRFHQECLDKWLTTRSGSCPNCRYDLRPKKDGSIDPSSSNPDIPNSDPEEPDSIIPSHENVTNSPSNLDQNPVLTTESNQQSRNYNQSSSINAAQSTSSPILDNQAHIHVPNNISHTHKNHSSNRHNGLHHNHDTQNNHDSNISSPSNNDF
ncbi:putative E3 ubiquitin-protein ligase RHA2B [Smittium culicis]|uniref:Putative E3 ubiquitin-protein ligase RHA2B n=1 Tax=Smittium culicis TaxID=133412 RepID=A0A1R1XWB4_9FUNG|nr:putative E3 ubiquitin-protein ligase RHA2B [Smittium culicis]